MKFISSSYDANTGEAVVVMQHLGLKFFGIAKAHPEEKNPSEYAGCYLAELRATIKALKYEREVAKNKADMALDFIKSCNNYTLFNKEDPSAKIMYRQLNKRINKVNQITDEINNYLDELQTATKRRDIILKAIERRKAEKDN